MKPPIRMKTIKLSVMLALAAILAVALEGRAQAGEEPTSKGAGAAKLIGRDRAKPFTTGQNDATKPMSCPKCRSEWKSRIDYTARGATKPVVWVEKHLCDGCDTTISVAGHGKAKHDVVTHKCSACGALDAACCATTKGGGPTKGMGES